MTRILITGSKGRMGKALLACAPLHPEVEVAAQIDIGDDLLAAIDRCDVVVDFSAHQATVALAALCARHHKAMVIGTTGHAPEERTAIVHHAHAVPLVMASNFSTGVNTLFWLTRKAAEILGPDFDVEIVEMHHRFKKDAPSGTAMALAEVLAKVREMPLEEAARYGREGIVGERTPEEIGVHSVRGGDVVGDHTVMFATLGERLELTHKASSRETFAHGALRAAAWVVKQKPGLYSMMEVLGLK
jgi:4-hydroxy-tetrahydrodipicolinate reductase